ncbi:MAG: TolC family protein [Bacteroidaceae bacterium]|nr:TolC family protein [Bacteroidaceae bacterium]
MSCYIWMCMVMVADMQGQTTDLTEAHSMTVEDCMRYAVKHSHGLRQRELTLDNAEATRMQAAGSFLPSFGASAGVQWNFGRAIDPETNTFTSVSTFNNGYGLSASLPVFDGLYRLHALRAARADVLMQKKTLQAERDQVALQTYQAFVDVVYAQEAILLAAEKLHESQMMRRRTQVMEEEGMKSPADVALMKAQEASDALTLTRQQNLLENCMLKLKEVMNWKTSDSLFLTSSLFPTSFMECEAATGDAESALIAQAFYNMQSARHNLRASRASLFPTLSLSAGINSSYFRNLNMPSTTPFGQQLKNNLGEYVSLNLSIPLFNRLGSLMSLRRAKNNLRIAKEQYDAKQTELEVLRRQAQLDVMAYRKESLQGKLKVAADSLAYELVRQQFSEGLASPIDLQTASATLLQSRAALLQSRLMIGIKEMQRRYYEGKNLWKSLNP